MELAHEKRIQLERKVAAKKEELSKIHIISSVDQLNQILSSIDDTNESSEKKKKKLVIFKEQVRARKKFLKQKVLIVFTHYGKQRPLWCDN